MINNYMEEVAHEGVYDSEDLDYQAESFSSQHFRKASGSWFWILMLSAPLWFTYMEIFHQFMPDDDNYKFQRPPPLNYPDDTETPDTEVLELFESKAHKLLYDAGVTNPPFFEVKDGKKVYSKWSGVNQPLEI